MTIPLRGQIFCLRDVAGSGKSTDAKEVVKKCVDDGWLVGRFFFSRGTTETMSMREFYSTVSDAFASINHDQQVQETAILEASYRSGSIMKV